MAAIPVLSGSPISPPPILTRRAVWAWAACAFLALLALLLWSCNTNPEDENILTLKLDSSRVGKFDSVLVEIYNGSVPGAGDTTRPVQSQTLKVSGTAKQITIRLSPKVKPDFSVVVTGYSGDQIAYRNLHTVSGFGTPDSTQPAVLLISRILADSLTLNVGETRAPTIKFQPENPGDKRIVLKSLDTNLAAVAGDSLKGVAAGRARIEAMTADGKVTVTFVVNVTAVRVTALEADTLLIKVGDSLAPAVKVVPDNATDKEYTLASLDTNLFVAAGKSVKGLKAGQGKLVLASRDGGAADTVIVRVRVAVTGIGAKDQTQELGDRFVPALDFSPSDATRRGYVLTSGDTTKVAVIGNKDSLEARALGSAKITVRTNDGGFTADFTVTVVRKFIHLKGITADSLHAVLGDTVSAKVSFDPGNATDQSFTLFSHDTSVAVVSGTKVFAKGVGRDTLTAKSTDGGLTADFILDVARYAIPVKGIKIDSLRALPGDTVAANVVFDPTNASEKGFALKSLDTALVDVNGGKLIAKALGRAKIEATTTDGGIKDTFTVSIELSSFNADIRPITNSKCAPCHIPPATFNWTDSAQLVRKGTTALGRLSLPDTAVGHMPVAGATGGPITARELRVLVGWLSRVSVPLTSITVVDTTVNMGDTLAAPIAFNPANASDQEFILTSLDTSVVTVLGKKMYAAGVGSTSIDVLLDEGNRHSKFKVTVNLPSFQKNVLPITASKCTPCHGPDQVQSLNWQDSATLIADGTNALDRLTRDPNAAGKMPLKGAPNGDLTPSELKILLTWLNSKVVPLKGITVPDDSLFLGSQKEPAIVWNPANATNKFFTLVSGDTAKVGVLGTMMVGKSLSTGTTLEVRTADGGFSKLITVKVLPVKVDSVAVRDTGCAVGDSISLAPIFFPANATNQAFTVVSKIAVPKVRINSGFIVGLTLGKDTLEATTVDGAKKARFAFTVGPVLPKFLSVRDTNGTASGVAVTPTLIWTPSGTTNKAYTLAVTSGDTTTVAAVRGLQMQPKTAVGQVMVLATSVADPTVTASFKFSVGPVGVVNFSVTPVTAAHDKDTLVPAILWNPTNATNKGFSLSVALADTSKLAVVGTRLAVKKIGTSSVTVTSLDSNKTAPWSVTAVRTSFQANLLNIMSGRCGSCHNAMTNQTTQPNWLDSATVVLYGSTIKTRLDIAYDPANLGNGHMPYGTTMPADTIAIIKAWLSQ